MEAATTTAAAPARATNRPFWREGLAPYAKADVRRSRIDIATSVVPYLALQVAMYLALDVSYWLVLAISVPAAGFLLRTFIVFHDCTHGSFMASKRGNTWLGIFTGLLVYTPFHAWKHDHARHHATSGDLDRRGAGDVEMITVREYAERGFWKRLEYRLMRNPVLMLVIGPLWSLAIQPRFVQGNGRPLDKKSVLWTDLILAVVLGGLVFLIGGWELFAIQFPCIMLAGSAGVFLFYVQHQFEGVYFQRNEEWSYADAALKGASHLKLPKVLQWFTGNIGLHHVHHLSARVPNYNLQNAHDANEFFHDVPEIDVVDGIRAMRLKLWDDDSARLVTWAEARPLVRAARHEGAATRDAAEDPAAA
jgi:omega-6 fatty acid desaturase (delta-12 desaturase)